MTELIIDRETWNRGGRWDDTMLFDPNHKHHNMCCLGIYLQQLGGISLANLSGVGDPMEVYSGCATGHSYGGYTWHTTMNAMEEVMKKLDLLEFDLEGHTNTPFVHQAMAINDNTLYPSEAEREEDLRELFESIGVELVLWN